MSTDLSTELLAATEAEAAAAAEFAQLRERKAAAERATATERRRREVQAWQDFIDGYDLSADKRAVEETAEALGRAVESSELGRALLAHVAAALRAGWRASLAQDAVAAGAQPAGSYDPRGIDLVGDAAAFAGHLLGPVVAELARRQVDAEVAQVRQQVAEAYASVHPVQPSGYRIEATGRTDDWQDNIGGAGVVFFADGVAYVMRSAVGDARLTSLLAYWRSLPDHYQVTEVYGDVPDAHTEALRRVG
ncbi:MAG: hypothetical protein AUI14_12150 [Actinobacteria bacterium 13_2_20CM_2_71_6]|nr:MAG: hypothetical protein AUI14_12150 [Actinobacteria bacterium 13_2_20CM_2_71_6]